MVAVSVTVLAEQEIPEVEPPIVQVVVLKTPVVEPDLNTQA